MFPPDSTLTMLHPLPHSTEAIASPRLFTYPFRYVPHPLCIAAAEDIKPLCRQLLKGERSGKMFGILVVEKTTDDSDDHTSNNTENTTPSRFYLAAFSGMLQGTYLHPGFVPPIYNLQEPDSYFKQEETAISLINKRIAEGEDTQQLRMQRRQRSVALQQWLFAQFHLLNALGEQQPLPALFEHQAPILSAADYFNRRHHATASRIPSGTGECCAPKLLQYAYQHHLRPHCMAEFWLGPSPHNELRIDGNYYPACQSKCRPLLRHMLRGLQVEENPMLSVARMKAKEVEYIYSDSDILVVCKPAGLPSVPGNEDMPSLLDIVRQRYTQATAVHRLDMDTSGLLLFALNEQAHKHLQQQFISQSVRKTYVALLSHPIRTDLPRSGTICLPLLPNPYDRPRQMVSIEHGKRAVTQYQMLSSTLVLLQPHTGRTHQLRVHAAHPSGLGVPISGDSLYGTPSERLCLHAQSIEFVHPRTNEQMQFEKKADFYSSAN